MIIDGSYGEGGGQILRTAIALSCVKGEEVEITNIRKGRKNPGLKNQHLHGLKLVGRICNADIKGLALGSQRIKFVPGKIKGGNYTVDIGTAGSITLILQISLIPSLFADSPIFLDLRGGTDVPFSPPIDYYRFVLVPILKKMKSKIRINLIERGYYPQGGGRVSVEIEPSRLRGINIEERGKLIEKRAYINLRNLPEHISKRMEKLLKGYHVVEDVGYGGISRGCGLLLVHQYENTVIAADTLCKRGVPAEKIAMESLKKIRNEDQSGATVDIHMADHLIPFAFVSSERSVYKVREITNHTRTNAWVIEKFGGNIELKENTIRINHAYI